MTLTITTKNSAMCFANKMSLGILVAIATMNFQAASACYMRSNLGGGGTGGRLQPVHDNSNFDVAGGGTTTCSVSGHCDYFRLQVVYGDDVGGSNAFNGASGSVGSLRGSAAKSCDFSVTMSDSNDATTLGLYYEYSSLTGGDLTLSCTCDKPLNSKSSSTTNNNNAFVPPPSERDQAPIVVHNSKLFQFLTEDKILHWFMSPVRMLCLGVSSNACQILERSRDEEGIHFYLVAGRSLAEFANQQGFFVQVFLIGIPVFLLFAFLNLLEVLLGGPGLAPFVCFAAITLGGWVVNKRHGMTSNSQESNKKLE
ncbi:expressed unknown protein [Seminavis robusta]|uniref:Uncharacterized protein n=1 Tax=Seminavis robusta TaxID=568900 RepID=A0A9N8HNJ3_9STRA|nr:expressed unknown protein [Seminavis robusta]|eukprot:Sro1001_g229750.1 n/a (311) ;mRNA; f:1093-2472